MKYRNVQKSGNMHYIYLPTKWCEQKGIGQGSRLEVDVDSSGNLVVSARAKTEPGRKVKITMNDNDFETISKVVMACFLNPVSAFEVDFVQDVDTKELLRQEKILSTTLIEIGDGRIYSEPIISIENPLSVFVMMVNKAKNLVRLVLDDYDAELIQHYEEEIDWNNIMINKAVIASFMHKRDAKRKLIELHYLSLISNYLERAMDHVVRIERVDRKEKRFLEELYRILSALYDTAKSISLEKGISHKEAMNFITLVKNLRADEGVFREMLIKKSLRYCSEVLMDWSVTNSVED